MLFAVAATAFVACSKEEVVDTPSAPVLSGDTKTITVTSAVTRTTIEDKKLHWAEGDTYGILFADADGKIIGSTKSPEYSAEAESYTLEVPAETAALYCYYPYEAVSESEAESAVSAGATSVKYGIVDLNIYDGEQEGGQYTYMAANAEVSEENTVNVKFELLAAILELNIYDSSEETPDHSALYNVAIYADKSAGWATLSFADGVKLHTEESNELSTFIRANFNSIDGVEVNVGTKEEPVKVYVPVLKGSYENFDIVVTTEDHSVGTNDNRLVISKGEKTIDMDYYTVKVDLADGELSSAGGGDETGVGHEFKNPKVSKEAGLGDMNAVINSFVSINTGDEGWANNQSWWSTEWQYALDVTGNGQLVVVSFDAWPTNSTKTFADELGKQSSDKVEFQGGSLLLYSYGKSWVVFYEEDYPIAYIYVNYHSEGGEKEDDDNSFTLASSTAKITKANGDEDWVAGVRSFGGGGGYVEEFYELTYTAADNDQLTFTVFPYNSYTSNETKKIMTKSDASWKYNGDATENWFILPDKYTEGAYTISLHGAESTSTEEFVVLLPDAQWGDPFYALHIVYSDGDGDNGGNGGEEGGNDGPTFVIADATEANATIKQATGNEDWAQFFADWNGGTYREDIEEYWELTVTGIDDMVYFSSCPKWSFEENDDYNPQFFYSNGSSWAFNYSNTKEYWTGMWHDTKADGYNSVANVLGESWSDSSADYIIVFFDLDGGWPVSKYALHVVYSKNEGGGNTDPVQPEAAFALSSKNVIDVTLTKAAGDEAWATFAAGRHSNIKEYWELSAKGAKDAAYVALSTCPQWSGTPTIYYASRGSYMANVNATTSKNYWTGTWYADNDTVVDLGVAGIVDFGDKSLDYIVILGDYALHVLYTIE